MIEDIEIKSTIPRTLVILLYPFNQDHQNARNDRLNLDVFDHVLHHVILTYPSNPIRLATISQN